MSVRVKICGISTKAAFDACVDAGADWIGFVFFANSPRAITPSAAAALSARVSGGPGRIGLFVNPTDQQVAAAMDALPLHALQLYAPPARIAELHARFGAEVWQALAMHSRADLPDRPGVAAALVVEPRPPAQAGRPGGNGQTMDWRLLKGWDPGGPWLLAGGLTPDNVACAIGQSGARAVDVSSGVESAPGVKDAGLIARFVREARSEAVVL